MRSRVTPGRLARWVAAAGVAAGLCATAAAPARADVEILDIPLNHAFSTVSGTADLTSAFLLPRGNYEVTLDFGSDPVFRPETSTPILQGVTIDGDVAILQYQQVKLQQDTDNAPIALELFGQRVAGASSPVHPTTVTGSVTTDPVAASCAGILLTSGLRCEMQVTTLLETEGAWGPGSLTYVLTAAEVAEANAAGAIPYVIDNANHAGQQVLLDMRIVSAPEPAAWALMVLGFGGAGAGLRRRRGAARSA